MLRKLSFSLIAVMIGLMTVVGSASASTVTYPKSIVHKDGALAYEHMDSLANEIGSRVAGTENERLAEQYIYEQFKRIGYETEIQEFSFDKGSESSNVVAYKPGKSSEQIIVGAHYDSVAAGKGVDDNASGVGVMLEVAEVLKHIQTPYDVVFIAFGAEEMGLQGSKAYVEQMTEAEIDNTVGMINLDSLAAGDQMYIYGNAGEDGFIRDQALKIAEKKKLDLETNPGLNPHYPAGTTGDWSDHAPFKAAGIPYGYLEATNWEIGALDGYDQTVEYGGIWHTEKDNLAFIEQEYPGRIQEHLSTFSTILTDLLKFTNKTSTAK